MLDVQERWRGEDGGYGYRWERSKLVKEFASGKSCCCQYVSRHASQVEGKIHDTWMIELFEL